jgi:hypothetical protein
MTFVIIIIKGYTIMLDILFIVILIVLTILAIVSGLCIFEYHIVNPECYYTFWISMLLIMIMVSIPLFYNIINYIFPAQTTSLMLQPILPLSSLPNNPSKIRVSRKKP